MAILQIQMLLLYTLTCLHVFLGPSVAEPVQYCKFAHDGHRDAEINFCMGLVVHENLTSSSHDLYLTMTHTRINGSNRGWTAIGLGSTMAGALMFIIYGDPTGHDAPIVSIRGATGHHQPSLITRSTIGGTDFSVLHAAWMPSESSYALDSNSYVARIEVVCYSCTLWPGAAISITDNSQPWMWAWNPSQEFNVYTYDAHLTMHKHHAGAGGWGNFYVDMPLSINHAPTAPSVPPIRPNIAAVGASDTPNSVRGTLTVLATSTVWHAHGLVMSVAFLLLFPAGVVALRSGSGMSVKYHWVLQLAALLTVGLGIMLGFFLRKSVNTPHQRIGIGIAVCLGIQGLLGWRHHVVFLRIRQRTWLSHTHVWLGRILMVSGWSNLVIGMSLRRYSTLPIIVMGATGCLELLGLTFFVWWTYTRAVARNPGAQEDGKVISGWPKADDGYFAVADDETEEDEEIKSNLRLVNEEDCGIPLKSL
ncbi:MAG: hypothetical protein LQ347_003796 [Umbilicaria vellea]|nr:MAG: hypothetical protein LQ347_003796 [Umbilicaria vellea]